VPGLAAITLMTSFALGGTDKVSAVAATAPSGGGTVVDAITSYFHTLDNALMPGSSTAAEAIASYFAVGAAALPSTRSLASYEADKVNRFHRWVTTNGYNYKSIQTRITIRSLTISPGAVNAGVSAVTTMQWSPPRSVPAVAFSPEKAAEMAEAAKQGKVYGPDDTVTSMTAEDHEMVWVRENGSWKIVSDLYIAAFDPGLASDHMSPRSELPGEPSAVGNEPVVQPATCYYCYETYNRAGAGAYADAWAMSYNPAYQHFSADCANFVSQSMHDGGGLATESSWYPYSSDWINVPHMYGFIVQNPAGSTFNFGFLGTSGKETTGVLQYARSYMLRGDLFMYDWTSDSVKDHVTITAAYLSDGTPLVDSHTTAYRQIVWHYGSSSATYYLMRLYTTIAVP
jgi:hypothetical protein